MAQFIPKDDLVAEINKRITDAPIDCYGHQRVWAYNDVKDIINTLEVKEVDLEKELKEFLIQYYNYDYPKQYQEGTGSNAMPHIVETAKYFFNLGLKAQKGE